MITARTTTDIGMVIPMVMQILLSELYYFYFSAKVKNTFAKDGEIQFVVCPVWRINKTVKPVLTLGTST